MVELAEWVAPGATMIAAMMTAANLGARVTGWGFVVFTVGSIAWSFIGMTTGQQPLLITNGFLTIVNLVGVWRWLGRQAKFEDGSTSASKRSAASGVPTLYSASGLAGSDLVDPNGRKIGILVDAMMQCDNNCVAYVIVTDGGKGGLNERLRGVQPDDLTFGSNEVSFHGSKEKFQSLPSSKKDNWPEQVATAET